jgi:hypothetical protein
MKMLITAALLTIAAPAFAQADPHAGHKEGQHEGHKMDCCKDADGNGKMDCCEKMKDGKAMDCCGKGSKKTGADPHAGHDMSKH